MNIRKLLVGITSVLTVAGFGVVPAATVFGAANPSGTGRPNQDCVSLEAAGGHAPGHASSSLGSVFNEPGLDSANGGTGNQHYEAAGAPSQYDVACFQQSQH